MKCPHCGSNKDLIKNGHNGSRQQYRCRKCVRESVAKFRNTTAGRRATRKAVAKYQRSHPERVSAWKRIFYLKPERKPCFCGEIRVDAHHPDVNKKEEIVFLCRRHHAQAHKLLNTSVII